MHRLPGEEAGRGGRDQFDGVSVEDRAGVGHLGWDGVRLDDSVAIAVERRPGGLHLRAVGRIEGAMRGVRDRDQPLVGASYRREGSLADRERLGWWVGVLDAGDQHCRDGDGAEVDAVRDGCSAYGHAHDGLYPQVGSEPPRVAAAGGGEGGDGPAGVSHHAGPRRVNATPEPGGKLVQHVCDVSGTVGHTERDTPSGAGRGSPRRCR